MNILKTPLHTWYIFSRTLIVSNAVCDKCWKDLLAVKYVKQCFFLIWHKYFILKVLIFHNIFFFYLFAKSKHYNVNFNNILTTTADISFLTLLFEMLACDECFIVNWYLAALLFCTVCAFKQLHIQLQKPHFSDLQQ